MADLRGPLSGLYLLVVAVVCVYGTHRWWLLYLYYRHRGDGPNHRGRFEELPPVTVQVPMYNEPGVARRVIDAVCRLDYPADRLQIQILDDSTDATVDLARQRVAHWSQRGVDIEYRHRMQRTGFKAGALADAMPFVTGRFIAIFDADFLPPPNFLKRTIHPFTDPTVGCVQTRWDHLNLRDGLLTRAQAIFLDGHFLIEHTARHQSDRWINFNGTAGVWRREAIASAGGWQHDTLTEDVDLSYRAQLAGWRIAYLPRVGCPAELPPQVNAFKTQQHRWSKGAIQTALKLLPRILRAPVPLRIKVEAFFHLTNPIVYLFVTLMVMLFYPVFRVNQGVAATSAANMTSVVLLGTTLIALGVMSAGAFYIAGQNARRLPAWRTALYLPVLIAIGVGIAFNNTRACLEALLGRQSDFIRTPKYNRTDNALPADTPNDTDNTNDAANALPKKLAPQPTPRSRLRTPLLNGATLLAMIELAMGVYCVFCAYLALQDRTGLLHIPFLLLFAAGYLYVGGASLYHLHHAQRDETNIPAGCDATAVETY